MFPYLDSAITDVEIRSMVNLLSREYLNHIELPGLTKNVALLIVTDYPNTIQFLSWKKVKLVVHVTYQAEFCLYARVL